MSTTNYKEVYNNYFSKAVEVHAKIVSRYKDLAVTPDDIEEWCGWCVTQVIKNAPQWFKFQYVKLDVTQYRAKEPCHVYRMLDVMDPSYRRVRFHDNGTYLTFNNDPKLGSVYNYDSCYVTYYGLPLDEEGKLLIPKGSMIACEYYCLKMLYEPEFMANRLGIAQWEHICDEYNQGLLIAWGDRRKMSRNHMEEMQRLQNNLIKRVGIVPTYNLG